MRRDEAIDILTRHRDQIRSLGVKRLALFGSTARDQAGPESDIDILVELDGRRREHDVNELTLMGYFGDLFGRPVDVCTPATLKPFHRANVLAEAIEIYPRPTRPANYPPEDIVPERSPRQRLQDMLEAIEEALTFADGKAFEDYLRDPLLRRGIERSVEVISEASRHLPEQLRGPYPHIAWKQIRDIGNVLRHAYPDVNSNLMWEIVTVHLPALRPVVEEIIAEVDRREGRA
ncbi:MAG: DUF86 domain-containing protein [Rhodospirillales bacterium]|nr:DUF86 domain-containing protein [Rhodospirillales bacterium]